jgi:hypothetical protein
MAASAVQQRVWFYMGKKPFGYRPDIALEALRLHVSAAEPMSGDCWASLYGFWAIVAEGLEPDDNHHGAESFPVWFSFLVGYYKEKEAHDGIVPDHIGNYFREKAGLELVKSASLAGAEAYRSLLRLCRDDIIKSLRDNYPTLK